MLARAQCQPFVLVWCSLIYFLWGWSLILCSSKIQSADLKNFQRSDLRDDMTFYVWFFSWLSTSTPQNISSWGLILIVSLFLIDLEQEVNWGGTNVSIIWERTKATLLLSWVSWCQNALHKPIQYNVTKEIYWALTACQANVQPSPRPPAKGNKKVSFH